MKPIEILMNEHRLIEQILSCLEVITNHADQEGKIDRESAPDHRISTNLRGSLSPWKGRRPFVPCDGEEWIST